MMYTGIALAEATYNLRVIAAAYTGKRGELEPAPDKIKDIHHPIYPWYTHPQTQLPPAMVMHGYTKKVEGPDRTELEKLFRDHYSSSRQCVHISQYIIEGEDFPTPEM